MQSVGGCASYASAAVPVIFCGYFEFDGDQRARGRSMRRGDTGGVWHRHMRGKAMRVFFQPELVCHNEHKKAQSVGAFATLASRCCEATGTLASAQRPPSALAAAARSATKRRSRKYTKTLLCVC
jgi:hypothetical protein